MRQNQSPPTTYEFIEITELLDEIDRVLPSIQGVEHRAIVIQMRDYLIAASVPRLLHPGEPINFEAGTEEMFYGAIEILRCCGIAPAGWPQPPGPEELFRSQINIWGWAEGPETGGPES
jgi:hypothetical protein